MNKGIFDFLTKLNKEAEQHNDWWCVPFAEGQFLHFLVTLHKPTNILELGTSIGFSTIWLASASQEYGGHVTTIDINQERIKKAQHHFKKVRLTNITVLEGDGTNILKGFRKKIDFVFFDAGKAHYLEQLKILEKNACINQGCVIAADNTKIISGKDNEKLIRYLRYVRNSANYLSCYAPFENGMEISVRV
jgi:predicted O-methyltransferase YrrM